MHPNKKAQTRDVPETRDVTQETPGKKRERGRRKELHEIEVLPPKLQPPARLPLHALASNEVSMG
jgi:hypothetical protein